MRRVKAWFEAMLKRPLAARLWQFIKFGVVGASNTLLSLGMYQLCVNVFGLNYLLANAIGFFLSVTNAYYWNNRYVFGQGEKKSAREHMRGYAKSLAAYGGAFLLDSALLVFWVEIAGVSEPLAPVLNLMITVPVNFLVNKYWTFRKPKK